MNEYFFKADQRKFKTKIDEFDDEQVEKLEEIKRDRKKYLQGVVDELIPTKSCFYYQSNEKLANDEGSKESDKNQMKYLIDEIKKNNNKKMSYLFTEEFYFELIDKEKKQIEESKGHEI